VYFNFSRSKRVGDDLLGDIEPKVEVIKTPANKGATDEQTVQHEEEEIKLDSLSVVTKH